MAKTDNKPEKKPDKGKKDAVQEAAATVAAAQAAAPLKVEVHFPVITDLKQAIGFDADNNLVMGIQFKVKVDQYELFRLVNLLKQPHGSLYAIIGSPQSAMDFKFTKEGKVEILKAAAGQDKAKKLPQGPGKSEAKPDKGKKDGKIEPVTFQEITFNHIPEEEKPFGVVIDFVSNGTGELHTVAGRGNSATEAVIVGVKATKGFPEDLNEPFEVVEAVKQTKDTPARLKIIRAIEVGSFDDKGDAQSETKGE